jgi:hypothetical protein
LHVVVLDRDDAYDLLSITRRLSSDERGYTAARAVLCGITAGDTTTGALIGAGIGMMFVAF